MKRYLTQAQDFEALAAKKARWNIHYKTAWNLKVGQTRAHFPLQLGVGSELTHLIDALAIALTHG